MKLLLDTHALIWWLAADRQLSPAVVRLLDDPDNVIYVSAASVWEIATKIRIGKLPGLEALTSERDGILRIIDQEGFDPLAITVEHAEVAGSLRGAHRDPFDRMLMGQSLIENIPLASNEEIFDAFGVKRIW
ncbi:type II toxin-antitoxin system VapC family toxin [Caenispirillum bisanense]|uniref:PIN domain nuclease, a component of toxin-antitoxin system (PIN domain) n=1 Tax=Caenispirillum bisanense TaxID=414052 RepID=A0A286GJ62_9PROT|nr:type II toxin-antitoxin system VapC family toxin [Caenispirillum bisanense]SOD95149.1 PIN domain nuclease, a component of toxin-antitoxin system (PIN domain) [Caenispirillum bisanense]